MLAAKWRCAMRLARHILLILILALAPAAVPARDGESDRLAAVAWLVGDWEGVGEGQGGISASSRRAVRTRNGHFIRIEGRSVYPKQDKNKSGEVHASLDLWSYDRQRKLLVMRQFDSLGFVSTYVQDPAASASGRVVLVSERIENAHPGWKTRYTYIYRAPNEYQELFELDMGKGLQPYVTNRFLRLEG
jgi:hypothetical protein